jgi:methionine-gamma-lyase
MTSQMNERVWYGGITIDVGSLDRANALMELMQEKSGLSSSKFRVL